MKLLKRNKAVILAMTLAPLAAACAHSRSHSETAPVPPAVAVQPTASLPLDPKLQMPLPYTFSRRGIAVQVNYVEFVGGQPEVNVSLRETRNQDEDLLASTLMQARTDTGQALPYTSYIRDGKTQSDPAMSLKSNEHAMITLMFQPPDVSSTTHATLLQFPTGKWWSSADHP